MDWEKLAQIILDEVGGPANIENVMHCATRLRLNLYDDTQAIKNMAKIDNLDGVLGVVNQGGQFQVIVGNDVPVLYDDFVKLYKNGGSIKAHTEDTRNKKEKKGVKRVLDIISGIFLPVIPAMAGSGMLKALLIVMSMLGWLKPTSQSYLILSFVSDTVFYFLPVMLAHSASVKLKTNPYVSMIMGAMLINPNFVQMVQLALKNHGSIKLFGLPVTLATYSSSVVPVLLAIWAMSYIEPLIDRIIPKVMHTIFTPLVELLVMTPLTFVVLAPIGTWLGDGLAGVITWINGYAGWAIPLIIGVLSPLLVMTGMHYALISVAINNLAKVGWENIIGPGMLVSNIAQGGAALAVATKTKDEKLRALGISTGLSAVLGITEPALYGINLRYQKPLISAMVGGGLGGLFLGIMKVRRFQQVPPGLLSLPSFIGNDINNLWFAVIGLLIAFVSSYVLQLFLGLPQELKPEIDKKNGHNFINIKSPLSGEVETLSDVNDIVFAQEMLGQGNAIFPEDGKIYAPFNGYVKVFNSKTKHAIGLVNEEGVELLIHCGLDTVKLKGQGFKADIKQNQEVKEGKLMLEMDVNLISKKGFDPIVMVLVTNYKHFTKVKTSKQQKVHYLDQLIQVEK